MNVDGSALLNLGQTNGKRTMQASHHYMRLPPNAVVTTKMPY